MDPQDEDFGDDKLAEQVAQLEGLTPQEIMEQGLRALLIDLVVRVKAKQASHQEKAILKGILKDAGMLLAGIPIEVVREAEQTAAKDLNLPNFETPDYYQ